VKFPSFDLVPWLNEAKGVKYDLANSAAPPPKIEDLGIDMNKTPLGYANIWGFPELRELVAETYGVDEGEILLSSGTQEATFLALATLIKPGDKVAAEVPSYPPIFNLPLGIGARLIPIKRTFKSGFAIDPDEVERALIAGAKAVIITSPHNPSGRALAEPRLRELCELVERYKSHLIVDEIYKEMMPKPPELARHLSERAITVSGVSKAYGLGGARVGWALSDRKHVKEMRLAKDYVSVSNSTHGEMLAIAALKNRDKILRKNRKHIQKNLATVERWMRSQSAMKWAKPDGATISFPKLPAGVKSMDFGKKALKKGLLMAPGKYFGLENHMRLTYGCQEGELKAGLKVLGKLLEGMN
jgi:aspartate/methionine/tyrosine aminotransferase